MQAPEGAPTAGNSSSLRRGALRAKFSKGLDASASNRRPDAMKLDYNQLLFANSYVASHHAPRPEAGHATEKSSSMLSSSFLQHHHLHLANENASPSPLASKKALPSSLMPSPSLETRPKGLKRRLSSSRESAVAGTATSTTNKNSTSRGATIAAAAAGKIDADKAAEAILSAAAATKIDVSHIVNWTPSKPRTATRSSARSDRESATSPSEATESGTAKDPSIKEKKRDSRQTVAAPRPVRSANLLGLGGGAMRISRTSNEAKKGDNRDEASDSGESEGDLTRQAGSFPNSKLKATPSSPREANTSISPPASSSSSAKENQFAQKPSHSLSQTGGSEGINTSSSSKDGAATRRASKRLSSQSSDSRPRDETATETPTSVDSHKSSVTVLPSIPSEFTPLFSANNVVRLNGNAYVKMECIGRGGSSKVYRVLSPECKQFALKRVSVSAEDSSSFANYANEITLLQRLRGNAHIITLEEAEVNEQQGSILMVMELGEVDLQQLLQLHQGRSESISSSTVAGFGTNFVRLTWQQMLEAVDALHQERVVHGDLKPANFVFCRGALKLIDFGIAKRIGNDTVNISRESQVGTLNYMSPEAIMDTGNGQVDPQTGQKGALMKLGKASDVWSLGCIIYQLAVGHTPFHHLRWVHKLKAIVDPNHEIDYEKVRDPALVDTIKSCLCRDPKRRATISGEGGLLSDPYLHPESVKPQPAVPASVVRCIIEQCITVTGSTRAPESVYAEVVQNLKGR